MVDPWEKWIPGVLSKQQVLQLWKEGKIRIPSLGSMGSAPQSDVDLSSFDLSLSDEAYLLKYGSIKPSGDNFLNKISRHGLIEKIKPDQDGGYSLTAKRTYLFKLKEQLHLYESPIYGQATAKSTVGRMDVLARLIIDGMDSYEEFDPNKKSTGEMFVEVTPITFNVRVRPDTCLTQLRLFKGSPEESEIRGKSISKTVLSSSGAEENDNVNKGTLSLNLRQVKIESDWASAFSTKKQNDDAEYIDLWKKGSVKPEEFWERVVADENERLRIEPGRFYIMRSREKICVPRGIAVYCRAIDETIGEMRIHYAGFAHPFFGERDDDTGTPLVFEVRGHDVSVSLIHGEKMARLVFYRMSEDSIAEGQNEYNQQDLRLSKIFSDWS